MGALRAVEVLGSIIFVILVFTQLVIPLWTGRRVFPLFRGKSAEERYVAAREHLHDVELTAAAASLEKAAHANDKPEAALPSPAETPMPSTRPSRATASARKRS